MGRIFLGVILLLLLIVIILPALLVRGFDFSSPPVTPREEGISVNLLLNDGTVERMPLEEYVKGVVAAEMPASFHPEALKAQAVVARSYAVKRMRELGGPGCAQDPSADLTADPNTDQAYISKEEARVRWGILGFRRGWALVEQAVQATQGLIVAYDSVVIDPVYHSTSGGYTENSEDVWQVSLPYLRSVPCPWDRHSPYYEDQKKVSYHEVASLIGDISLPALTGSGDPIRVLEYSDTGRVKSVRVGERVLSGTELRGLLGLRSTKFTWETGADGIVFKTTGYGHGVGMSQYGADGMARQGKDFRAIIKYFYKDVEIVPIF